MPVTNLANGIGTVPGTFPIAPGWPLPYGAAVHEHFEEFGAVFRFDTAPSQAEDWMVFDNGQAIVSIDDGANGILQLLSDDDAGDFVQIQQSYEDMEPIGGLNFSTGFQSQLADFTDLLIGVANNVGAAAFDPNAEGFYFRATNDAELDFVIRGPSGTLTAANVFTMPNEEYFSVQFAVRDNNTVDIGIGGEIVETLAFTEADRPTGLLCMSASITSPGFVFAALLVDYMWVANRRPY